MQISSRYSPIVLLVLISTAWQSCVTQNLFDSGNKAGMEIDSALLVREHMHRLQPDDKISVSIWDHEDLSVGSIFGIYNSNEVYGKWVLINQEGYTELPQIGRVHLGGLTTVEAAEKLKACYARFIVDPVVVVKILNREVTVLGEVRTPGAFLLEKEENNLFEILGRAGGLDFYAEKREIKLIRGGKEHVMDLTSMEQYGHNNILLHSGDVVYVPTRKGKTLDRKAPLLIPFASVATTLVVILSFLAN